jgi:hypothetical protein
LTNENQLRKDDRRIKKVWLIRKKVEVWVADLEGNWVYGYI